MKRELEPCKCLSLTLTLTLSRLPLGPGEGQGGYAVKPALLGDDASVLATAVAAELLDAVGDWHSVRPSPPSLDPGLLNLLLWVWHTGCLVTAVTAQFLNVVEFGI